MGNKQNVKENKSPAILITIIACAVVLAVVIGWAVVMNHNSQLKNLEAMKIGDYTVGGLEYSYQYKTQVNNFYSSYSQILSYLGVDLTGDLTKQQYTEDMTWADLFNERAQNSLTESYLLYSEAKKENFVLSESATESMEKELEEMKASVEAMGVSADYYVSAVYGDGMTWNDYREFYGRVVYASNYYNHLVSGYEFSDSEINTYYNENSNNFRNASYRLYSFDYNDDEGDTTNKDGAYADAKNFASAITDDASYESYLRANVLTEAENSASADDFTLHTETAYSGISATEVADWIFDSSRNTGDVDVIESGNSYYVVYFISCARGEYKTVSMRHILFQTSTVDNVAGADGSVDENATAAAQTEADNAVYAKVEDVLAKFNAGNKSEDSFAALANEYSEDSAEGGLYENIYKGAMVEEIESWLFDGSHSAGDIEIIRTDYGYHVVYFVGYGDEYWHVQVESALKAEKYQDYLDGLKASADIQINQPAIDKVVSK